MAISKFAVACMAAVLAGGAAAGLTLEGSAPPQVQNADAVTPISAVADPQTSFKDAAVQFTSGKAFGHVVAIATNGAGRVSRIRVALDAAPAQRLWLDQDALVYSRARNVIVTHDIHAPAMAVADAR